VLVADVVANGVAVEVPGGYVGEIAGVAVPVAVAVGV